MNTPNMVRLCVPSTSLEDDWRKLYASAFPVAEQEPEQRLQQLIDAGRLLYHKTIGKQGELLCFSLVSLAPDFSFLAYIATDPTQRSGGYGSKHMRALIDLLKEQYPNHIGLFLEIESTHPRLAKLSDEDKQIRNRRLSFYRRLGARRLCRSMQYLTPSKNGDGEQELDILYLSFNGKVLDHKEKERIVAEVYSRFYELPLTHDSVVKVLGRVASCSHKNCEDEPVEPVAPVAPSITTASANEPVVPEVVPPVQTVPGSVAAV